MLTLPLPMIISRMGPSDDRSNQAHDVTGAGRFYNRRFAAFAPSAPRLVIGTSGLSNGLELRARFRTQFRPLLYESPYSCGIGAAIPGSRTNWRGGGPRLASNPTPFAYPQP